MRLDRFIVKSTELTRAEARDLLKTGRVRVNGKVLENGFIQVHENNRITIDEDVLIPRASRYIMMHKPLGAISSNADGKYRSLFQYVDVERAFDLHIVGRLDVDTTGLVLLTDDGSWTHNIIMPKKQCQKVYRVGLRDPIADDVASRFEKGLQLQGETSLTLPALLEVISPKDVLLTITEGRYHQVKRMFRAVGNRVVTLHRQKIGDIDLDIELGQWRHLSTDEVAYFRD